jgi:hypothetical protein
VVASAASATRGTSRVTSRKRSYVWRRDEQDENNPPIVAPSIGPTHLRGDAT